jgi:tripeptide aminopeptidase
MPGRESLLDRFCRYVQVDTQSNAASVSYPSTEKQKDLLRILVDDLKAAGLADAEMADHGYVMATLPSNIPPGHPAFGRVPVIGLLGHVDTYFEVSGTGVKPQVHRDYDGGDITLPGDPSVVIRAAEEPALAACQGMTIITADGTTLLGADDKAGVAEIVEALWRFQEDPARLHGPIRVAFTPDEEVGRGTEHFDVKRFGAACAYTVDGSGGYAKGKMINAVRVAADLVMALPQHRTPETTEGREGYLHPTNVAGNVSETRLQFIVRDFTEPGLRDFEDTLRAAAAWAERKYRGARVTVEVRASYRNMKYVLDQHPHVTEYAEEAIRRAGLTPKRTSIRGGTDGARLSFMGVPTPNLFDGSMNFHGKKEYVPLEWMQLAVETLLHLCDVWVERSRG